MVFLQSVLTFSLAEHCTPWEGGAASPQVTAFLFSFALLCSAPPWQHHATIQECFLLSSPLIRPFWIRFSLFLYLFFFQGCEHHSKQPFYSDGLESFLCTSKKARKILQKEKRRKKKILLSLENSLVCYRAFLTLHCSADSTINRLSLEIKTYIFKKYLFNVAFSSTLIFLSVLDRKCEKMKRWQSTAWHDFL